MNRPACKTCGLPIQHWYDAELRGTPACLCWKETYYTEKDVPYLQIGDLKIASLENYAELEENYGVVKQQYLNLFEDNNALQKRIAKLNGQLDSANKEIQTHRESIDQLGDELHKVAQERDKYHERLKKQNRFYSGIGR